MVTINVGIEYYRSCEVKREGLGGTEHLPRCPSRVNCTPRANFLFTI